MGRLSSLDTAPGDGFALANDKPRRGLAGNPGRGDVRGSNDGNASVRKPDPYALGDNFSDQDPTTVPDPDAAGPANVAASDSATAGAADVTWDAFETGFPVRDGEGYNVYVDVGQTGTFAKDNATLVTAESYETTAVGAGTHDIKVRAVDENGHEFAESDTVPVTVT